MITVFKNILNKINNYFKINKKIHITEIKILKHYRNLMNGETSLQDFISLSEKDIKTTSK